MESWRVAGKICVESERSLLFLIQASVNFSSWNFASCVACPNAAFWCKIRPVAKASIGAIVDFFGNETSSCHGWEGQPTLHFTLRIQIPPHIQTMELSTPKPVSSCVQIFKT